MKACNMLTSKGIDNNNVVNLDGGITKWQGSGMPVKDATAQTTENTAAKACCANPNSKKCNPDGSCKTKKNGKAYKQCKK